MTDITGRRRQDSPHSIPGSLTLSEGRTQILSGKTEVGRSFSSRDAADLSGTIQDSGERPAMRSQDFAGGLGGRGGPALPGTGDGENDLSGIGRPAEGTGQPSPKPAEADKDLKFKITPPAKPKPQVLDISQFKNPDGSYDMARIQAVVSTRVQTGIRETRAERRAQRARGSTVSVPAMKPLDTLQATKPLGREEEAYPSQGGRSSGRGGQQRRPRGNLNLSPIAERNSMGSKETENPESQKKTVSPGDGEDLETGKVDSDKGKRSAVEPVADDDGSLYSASPPRHPVPKPLPHGSNTSPGRKEKYRRWAAEPADPPTVEEKFQEWVDRGRSSEGKTAAQELEAWAQNDLYDAREKHLAWLFQQRSAASRQLKIGTEQSKLPQLENVIIQCTLSIKEAIRLEEKRQNRNAFRNNVKLETNVLVKRILEEVLQEMDREIEVDEKVEQVKLQMHLRPDSVWRKAFDMMPAERAALDIQAGHHFAAPAQQPSPMVLRESFAEQLLRDKWEKEDAPEELEDLFDHIGTFSDSQERDTYWEAFQDIRRAILLQRNKELTDLWKQQADEVKADRQDAWLKSEAEAEKKLLKLRQLDKPNKEEEEAKKRHFTDTLAAKVAKNKVEDVEMGKKLEDIEGVCDPPNVPPVAGQRKRTDISGLLAALIGRGVYIPEPATQGEKDSGRKGLLNVRTAPKAAGDIGEAEAAAAVNVSLAPRDSAETEPRTNSTEEEEKIPLPEPRPGSPFRAENSLSPIQEQRTSLTFETDREVADFLEYMAMVRHNEEVVRTGEGEPIDPELLLEKEKTVMDSGPIDPAEEEKSQKRIQAAKKRLEKIVARLEMPKEELKALEEKERKQRKMAREKKDREEAAAWEEAERLRKQELEDAETARGKAEAEEKAKEEERKRNEIAKGNKAEEERKEREKMEMAVRDQINKEREEKAKADKIARDKMAKDLKDKEEKKKPDSPTGFAGDILAKIKNDLLAKAGGVDLSKPAGEAKPKQENKDLDDYIKEIKRKLEEEGRARKENTGKGKDKPEEGTAKDKDKPEEGTAKDKDKPEENPPAETDSAKKALIEKDNREEAARRREMERKDLEAARVRNEEAEAKKKLEAEVRKKREAETEAKKKLEAEAAKDKPTVDYAARDKAERLAREERERETRERETRERETRERETRERETRERETRERDRLAQERADELKNRPAPTAEQKAEAERKRATIEDEKKRRDKKARDEEVEIQRQKDQLAEERKAKETKDKAEKEQLWIEEERRQLAEGLREQKRKEREEMERVEQAEKNRLAEEEMNRLYNELQREKYQQQKEKDRMEREKRDREEREKNERLEKEKRDRVSQEEKDLKQKDLEETTRLKKVEEDRLARERIAKKRKEKKSERSVRVETLGSETKDPDLRKKRKEREKKEKDKRVEELAAAAALANRAAGGGLFQNIANRLNFPDLSWLTPRGPTHLQVRPAADIASNPPSPSVHSPVPADYELAPDSIAWMHAYAAKAPARRKISLNLMIFTSAKHYLPDATPPHYLACHDIPVVWNVSQLKRHLSAIVQRAKVGGKKTMKLRIERRWLKNGSRTLLEEGFRDWESAVVVMVEEGENVEEGDWKECVREADGMAGWIEGWPGKGELSMPGDRKAWLAEAFEGVFEGPLIGK